MIFVEMIYISIAYPEKNTLIILITYGEKCLAYELFFQFEKN